MNVREQDVQARAEAAAADGMFLGGPARRFVAAGRMQLDLLRAHGLEPHHNVLDVGCGALRAGIWLMSYLEPGRYHAIEPNREMLKVGLDIAGSELVDRAQPVFDHNDRFDLSVFGVAFDVVLARSIWTHASLSQITAMLDGFATTAAAGAQLFASVKPAILRPYRGRSWVGISHRSDEPGMVRHRIGDLRALATERGLAVRRLHGWRMGGQTWLRVTQR